jgi:tyrosine-protein kinase Etk/Wzc
MEEISRYKDANEETKSPEPLLVDYLIVLLKRGRIILLSALLAALLALGYTLITPDSYTATAQLLAPQRSDQGIAGLLAKMQGNPIGTLFGEGSTSDIYVGILESRSVADQIIQRFGLKERYRESSLEDTREKLKARTKMESGDDQIVHVSVKDTDPKVAADMANAYAEELNRVNQTVNMTEGHLKRVFLEDRLEKVKEELLRAESQLKNFQEKHRLVALEDQAKATIDGAAKIVGDIIAAETELEVFKKFGTERNNEAVRAKTRIAELSRQLAKIEEGNSGSGSLKNALAGGQSESNFYIPFNELPSLGMQLIRLIREAKIQEELFKLMTGQYELAKIEEARDINTLQILYRAVPPDRKSGPSRILIVLLCTAAGGFMGIFLAFVLEFLERLKLQDPARYHLVRGCIPLRKGKET